MSKDTEKSEQAAKIIRNHMLGSVAAGLVPIPLVDLGILTAVQLRMVQKLAKHYDVEFSEQRAKSLIGSLVSVGAAATAGSILRALLPGAARTLFGLGSLTVPAATTWAVGRVFIKHFESGGTIWTFDPSRAKKDYEEELKAAPPPEPSYAGVRP